jgi:hypothetical protein
VIANTGGIDPNMTMTTGLLSRNKDGLKQNGMAFELEMQQRFSVVNDSIKKLKYQKSKLLEDIDILIKNQIYELTKETDVQIDLNASLPRTRRVSKPDVKEMLYTNDQPWLQFFEESDPQRKHDQELQMTDTAR